MNRLNTFSRHGLDQSRNLGHPATDAERGNDSGISTSLDRDAFPIKKPLMNLASAEQATGLTARHRPEAKWDVIRCCLGEYRQVTRSGRTIQIGGFVEDWTIKEGIFHVIGYGSTWERAVLRAKQNQRRNGE